MTKQALLGSLGNVWYKLTDDVFGGQDRLFNPQLVVFITFIVSNYNV